MDASIYGPQARPREPKTPQLTNIPKILSIPNMIEGIIFLNSGVLGSLGTMDGTAQQSLPPRLALPTSPQLGPQLSSGGRLV